MFSISLCMLMFLGPFLVRSPGFSLWTLNKYGPTSVLPHAPVTCAIWLLLATDTPSVDQLFVSLGAPWHRHTRFVRVSYDCHLPETPAPSWVCQTFPVRFKSCWGELIHLGRSIFEASLFEAQTKSKKAHSSPSIGEASWSPECKYTGWMMLCDAFPASWALQSYGFTSLWNSIPINALKTAGTESDTAPSTCTLHSFPVTLYFSLILFVHHMLFSGLKSARGTCDQDSKNDWLGQTRHVGNCHFSICFLQGHNMRCDSGGQNSSWCGTVSGFADL